MPGLIQEAIKGVMAVITDQLAIHKQEIARIEQDVASTHERLNTVVTSIDHLENYRSMKLNKKGEHRPLFS